MGVLNNLPVILAASTAFLAGLYGYMNNMQNSQIYRNMCLFLVAFYIIGQFIKRTVRNLIEDMETKAKLRAEEEELLLAEGGVEGGVEGDGDGGVEDDSAAGDYGDDAAGGYGDSPGLSDGMADMDGDAAAMPPDVANQVDVAAETDGLDGPDGLDGMYGPDDQSDRE